LISSGELKERVHALVRLRDREERMAVFSGKDERWEIHEYHNPHAALMRQYPVAVNLEETMIGEVLGVPVRRTEEGTRVVFSAC
jgi:predicted ArsR family transcriptional regulator